MKDTTPVLGLLSVALFALGFAVSSTFHRLRDQDEQMQYQMAETEIIGLRVLLRKQEKTAALCNDTLVTCIGWQARLKTVLETLERKP